MRTRKQALNKIMNFLDIERIKSNLLASGIFFFISILIITLVSTISLTRDKKIMNLTYDQLTYEVKEFDYYKVAKSSFFLYFKDGSKYEIFGYADGKNDILSLIENGDTIPFYSLNGEIIIELQYNDFFAVTLNNYKSGAHQNYIISLILLFAISLGGIFSLLVCIKTIIKLINASSFNIKESNFDDKLMNPDIYEKIQKSIYKKDGIYYGSILELIDSPKLIATFCHAIMYFINDNELTLIIDEGGKDGCIDLVFYKFKNKLSFNLIFRDENEPFQINSELFWYFPSDSKVTIYEKEEFEKAIKEYCFHNPDMLIIENKKC